MTNLTQQMSSLDKAADRIVQKLKNISSTIGSGKMTNGGTVGNFLSNGMGQFSSMSQGGMGQMAGNLLGGALGSKASLAGLAVQAGANLVGNVVEAQGKIIGGMGQMMPEVSTTMSRMADYYNASVYSGARMSTQAMAEQTTAFMKGGITSAGSDARTASYLSQRGMTAGSVAFNRTLTEVSNAAKYLNMSNENAAVAIEQLSSGTGSAALYNTLGGVMTSDPRTGKTLSQAQIYEQIYGRLTAGRDPSKMSVEGVQASLRSGEMGSLYAQLGWSQDQQDMFSQFAIAKAQGKDLDLSDTEAMEKLMGGNAERGIENPNQPGYDLASSEASAMNNAQQAYLNGIKAVTPVLQTLTEVGGELASVFGSLKSGFQTLQGNTVFNGFMEAAGGVFDMVTAPFRAVASALGGGETGKYAGAATGSLGGAVGVGTRTSAFSPSSVGSQGLGGENAATASNPQEKLQHPIPGARITAKFGQTHSTLTGKLLWPNGHKGLDYEGGEGTTVLAAGSGTATVHSGGELGNYVRIKHANGMYSFYAHLSSILISDGNVSKGQPVGLVGKTGRATGAHLHFALSTTSTTGGAVDPLPYIDGSASYATGVESNGGGGAASNQASVAPSSPSSTIEVSTAPTAVGGSAEMSESSTGEQAGQLLVVDNMGYRAASTVTSSGKVGSYSAANSYVSAKTRMSGNRAAGAPLAFTGDPYVAQDGAVNVHAGEAILSADEAAQWRASKAGIGGGGDTRVTINLRIDKASDEEARLFAERVKQVLEQQKFKRNMARF